jgi:hypothetical protein
VLLTFDRSLHNRSSSFLGQIEVKAESFDALIDALEAAALRLQANVVMSIEITMDDSLVPSWYASATAVKGE